MSDTNQPVQSQKKARSLKLCIKVEEELYYPCIENKGADQLICVFVFAHMQIVGFPMQWLIYRFTLDILFCLFVCLFV